MDVFWAFLVSLALTMFDFVFLLQSRLWPAVCDGRWTWSSCWTALREWGWRTTAGPKSSSRTWPAASTWPTATQTRGTLALLCCSMAALQNRGWSSRSLTTSLSSVIRWPMWTTWIPLPLWAVLSSMPSTILWSQGYKETDILLLVWECSWCPNENVSLLSTLCF